MSFHLQIDAERRFVELRYEGVVDTSTVLEALRAVQDRAPFDRIRYGLSDFRNATLAVDKHDLPRFVAAKNSDLFGEARWAFLMDSPRETAIGMLYTTMKEQLYECEIFSTRQAALDWLEVPVR